MPTAVLTVAALCRREILKFVRDRSRVAGALVQPLAFWLLLGLGFQGAFQMPDAPLGSVGYVEFLFPGILALVLLFTAIFSTISIVEERGSGFLQTVLIAPTPRSAIVFGNALGGTLIATVQALLFVVVWPWVGPGLTLSGLAYVVLICLGMGIGFTALGCAIAWRTDTTRGFHAIMNLFLLPLWFLSSAMFPLDSAATGLRELMLVNPVSYAVSGLRHGLYVDAPATLADPITCLVVTWGFALVMIAAAVWSVRQSIFRTDTA